MQSIDKALHKTGVTVETIRLNQPQWICNLVRYVGVTDILLKFHYVSAKANNFILFWKIPGKCYKS